MKQLHDPKLLAGVSPELLTQAKTLLGVRIFAIERASILLSLLIGNAQSCCLSGFKHPVVILNHSECVDMSQALGLSVNSVAESVLLHELGHSAFSIGRRILGSRLNHFENECWAWQFGEGLHEKFGRSSAAEFAAVRDHCLKSYQA